MGEARERAIDTAAYAVMSPQAIVPPRMGGPNTQDRVVAAAVIDALPHGVLIDLLVERGVDPSHYINRWEHRPPRRCQR